MSILEEVIEKFRKKDQFPQTSFENISNLPDVVFFDYDGTISDNAENIVKAFKFVLKKNFTKKQAKEIKKIKKDSEQWAFIKQNYPIEMFSKCNADYDEFLSNQKFHKVRGALKLIKRLYRFKVPMIVISQKRGEGLRDELKKAKIDKYFKNAHGTLDFGELQKPSPEFLQEVKNANNITSQKSWVIGDRIVDVITALNLNGKAFIIDKSDFEEVVNNNGNLIGTQIFFTSYLKLKKLVNKLHKMERKMEKKHIII